MADNLTSKQITSWKKKVDSAISKLTKSFNIATKEATALKKVTASGQDENNLSYRFNDLAKLTNAAEGALNRVMSGFDTNLTTYISTVKHAEDTTAENVRKKIDQFAEAASQLNKLKI